MAALPVRAAGFWNLDRGASNYARGGANIAAPRDPTGIYANPAALAGLSGLQLMIDGNAIVDNRRFTRAPDDPDNDGELESYDEAINSNPTYPPSPGAFVIYNMKALGLDKLTAGAGAWGPPRSDTTWPHDGPQRYSLMESHSLQIHYGVAAAYELPWYKIRIGATAMLINQLIRQSLRLNALPDIDTDDSFDVEVDVAADDNYIPSGIFGVSAQPVPWLIIAASYQAPWDVKAKGTAKITPSKELKQLEAEVHGDKVELDLKMAPIARVALQFVDPEDAFDVELAAVWEGWSRNQAIAFKPQEISFHTIVSDTELGDITFQNHWRDTYSLRLGGRYDLVPGTFTLRAGTYYERSAVPPEYRSPGAFDFDRLGVTVGGRVDLPYDLWLDFAAGYVHWFTNDLHDSKVTLSDPLTGDEKWAIGNGEYDNWQLFELAAIGAAFNL